MNIYGFTEDKVLEKIKGEYAYGLSFVQNKRILFNSRQALYNNPMKDEDRINVNLCYQFMTTLLAIYYTDEPEVQFTSQDIWNDDIAENMDNVYKFDLKEMKMDQIKYLLHRHRFWYGVGIRIMTGWNSTKLIATFEIVDPRCWIPDPDGDPMQDNFKFHGFEMKASLESLISDGNYFNLDGLSGNKRPEDQKNDQYDREVRGLNNPNDGTDNDIIPIYHHFTILGGKKFMFTTVENNTRIIRVEEIEAVTEDEQKDASLIQFPIVLNHRSPVPGDPFGICVPDIIEDKQKHMNKYYNLIMIKASRMALGNDRLYDTRLIKNRADLEKPSLGGKYIGVDAALGNIDRAIYEIPQEQIGSEIMNIPKLLKEIGFDDTGISELTMGGQGDRSMTARESQTVQQNANTRLMLANQINNRGEQKFAVQIYRAYLGHFKETDKKFVRINQGFSIQSIKFAKKDFLINTTPYIHITQKSDVDALNQQNKANYMAIYPLLQQDPSIPAISKVFGMRKLLKLNGLSRSEISVISPPSVAEMNAIQQVELLNRNIQLPEGAVKPDDEHMTYIIIYQRAFDTEAKSVAIETRKQAYIQSGQAQQQAEQQPQGGGAANMAGNMLMSNAISKGQNPVSSVQQIQP